MFQYGRVDWLSSLAWLPADPYLNTDAGTMSPFEHGEVFVLDDGGEVNDLGFHILHSGERLLLFLGDSV